MSNSDAAVFIITSSLLQDPVRREGWLAQCQLVTRLQQKAFIKFNLNTSELKLYMDQSSVSDLVVLHWYIDTLCPGFQHWVLTRLERRIMQYIKANPEETIKVIAQMLTDKTPSGPVDDYYHDMCSRCIRLVLPEDYKFIATQYWDSVGRIDLVETALGECVTGQLSRLLPQLTDTTFKLLLDRRYGAYHEGVVEIMYQVCAKKITPGNTELALKLWEYTIDAHNLNSRCTLGNILRQSSSLVVEQVLNSNVNSKTSN